MGLNGPGPSVILSFTTVIHAQIFFTLKKAAVNKNYDKKFVNYGCNGNDNTGPWFKGQIVDLFLLLI